MLAQVINLNWTEGEDKEVVQPVTFVFFILQSILACKDTSKAM